MADATKQVRVDNWAVFFLQRLQMYFSKTDYCDMTLQFEGNVQLKVHKLVINACTEYFQLLEQTCTIEDNVILMPSDLQADVIVPIINFMYTGMLEFQLSIYEKLYKTAQIMNITILTKLLEAQKLSVNTAMKANKKKHVESNHNLIMNTTTKSKTIHVDLPAPLPGRKLPVWKRRSVPITTTSTPSSSSSSSQTTTYNTPSTYENKWNLPPDPLSLADNTPKPTRFEWPDEDMPNLPLMDTSFESISYTSKPLLTQDEETTRASTSFDDLKQLPNASHTTTTTIQTIKTKSTRNLDMEELKNYVKEQKIRSGLSTTNDDIIDDNDLDHYNNTINDTTTTNKRKIDDKSITNNKPVKKVRFNENLDNKQTTISVTTDGKTSSKLDHNKIVTEILKKYPQLVKENKNIRLKIMSKNNKNNNDKDNNNDNNKSGNMRQTRATRSKLNDGGGESSKFELKINKKSKDPTTTTSVSTLPEAATTTTNNDDNGPWVCVRCSTPDEIVEFVLYYLYRKHMTELHNEKFDARSCKYCGHYCNKHNLLIYHLYTKHGMKPPTNYNFPKCNKCPFIAITQTILNRHKLRHNSNEQQCVECKLAFKSHIALTSHIQITGHTGKTNKNNFDCQYCTKRYQSGINLFTHVRMQHRNEAIRDGLVSIDEDDDFDTDLDDDDDDNEDGGDADEQNDEYILPEVVAENPQKKVNILSNVKVSSSPQQQQQQQPQLSLEPSSEAEALNNVASGIATSLGLVDIVVLNDNQQIFLQTDDQQTNYNNNQQQQQQQDQQQTNEQTEFILPELSANRNETTFHNEQHDQVITTDGVITQSLLTNNDIASTDELVMVLTDHDYGDNHEEITSDNSNIVVLYSHPVEGQQNQYITSQGNIMVNSRTGMIEIRNGAGVTTTTTTTTTETPTTTTTDQQTNVDQQESHIESIEMIQREIESHTNDNNTTLINEEKSKDDDCDQIIITELSRIDNNQDDESKNNGDDDDNNEENQNIADNIEEIAVIQNNTEVVEIKEENDKIVETTQSTTDDNNDDNDDDDDKGNTDNLAEQEEGINDHVVSEQQSPDKAADPVDDQSQLLENAAEASVEPDENNQPHISDDSKDVKEEKIDNDVDDNAVVETQKTNNVDVDDVAEIQEESTIINQSNEDHSQSSTLSQLNDDNNDDDKNHTDAITITTSDTSNDNIKEQSNSSMKIAILDDWEDTDSQQSDHKDDKKSTTTTTAAAAATGETVNKLMDDWEDEDEDELKKDTNE